MDKEKLLEELSIKIKTGELDYKEVVERLNVFPQKVDAGLGAVKKSLHFSVTKMLYVLGVAIVVVGLIIFIGQIWGDIGSFGRIFVTLGLGLFFAGMGSVLFKQKPENIIGAVFHLIGGLMIPGGALVSLYEFNSNPSSIWPFTVTFGFIFLFYWLLNLVHKNIVLTFFTIANGTAFIYLLFELLIDNIGAYNHGDLYAYLTMVMGISYLLLAWSFKNNWNNKLIGLLQFVGTAGFLVAGFSQIIDNGFWQLIYLLFLALGFFLSVYIKSRIVLAVNTIALIAYVSYITSEYFADSLGWPISLVILGFVFIGLGYGSVAISKRYIK